jgi:hypothetical protein
VHLYPNPAAPLIPHQLPAVPLEAALERELRCMLAVGADRRPLAADFAAGPWFTRDPQLRTLASLAALPMADTLAKAAFLRELARTWQQFDLRVLLHKVRTIQEITPTYPTCTHAGQPGGAAHGRHAGQGGVPPRARAHLAAVRPAGAAAQGAD